MESIVLGSGRDCHAGSLGFERSFEPAFLAYHVTAFPCGLCVQTSCIVHSSSSNFQSSYGVQRPYNTSREYEERVQAAKSAWLQGQFRSVRASARAHNVSQSPLIFWCP